MITSPTRNHQGIAFVGNYLPRVCGIATFTSDLAEAVERGTFSNQPVIVVAMNDRPEGYAYPDRVKFEVRQDYQIDYARAADFLNFSRVDVVCLQHEYGIFGGEWGSHLLTLIRDLHVPVVVTCHTIVRNTQPFQKEVFREIVAKASKLVVMSETAVHLMEEIYDAPRDKLALVPHGIHDVPFVDPNFYKDKFAVEGRTVLLTFGLLHRDKGVEYVIDALPEIIEHHPKTTYVILGATHPNVVRTEGESYRLSLQRRVRELGIEDHVLFHPRFVELDELLEYLGAADINVTPYLNAEQIASGALSYAIGSGKAVVSTPYWYAEELLAGGRGRLVPFRDAKALAKEINSLLDDEVTMSAVRKKAYLYSRNMTWHNVAHQYLKLFDEVRSHATRTIPVASALSAPLAATSLPTPKIDHLAQLCDDTGPAHHARYAVPDWSYGYHLHDAAAVLVTSAKFHNVLGDPDAARIARICTALLQVLVGDGTNVQTGLSYARSPLGAASDSTIARALWALGYVVSRGPAAVSPAANDLFQQLMPRANLTTPRARAYGVLGAANYLLRFPGASDERRFVRAHAEMLKESCEEPDWANRWGGADWPVAASALVIAVDQLDDDALRATARRLISQLLELTHEGTSFHRPGERTEGEELPTTAAAFIEALVAAVASGESDELLKPIRSAADWFLGANRRGVSLYDFSTGGCSDALNATGVNRNQGTEATAACVLALLTLTGMTNVEATTAARPRKDKSA